MSSDINLNPANEPRFPISPTVLDTEGHIISRARRIEEAGDDDAAEDTEDTEGHIISRNRRIEEAGDDTEGHRRAPLA